MLILLGHGYCLSIILALAKQTWRICVNRLHDFEAFLKSKQNEIKHNGFVNMTRGLLHVSVNWIPSTRHITHYWSYYSGALSLSQITKKISKLISICGRELFWLENSPWLVAQTMTARRFASFWFIILVNQREILQGNYINTYVLLYRFILIILFFILLFYAFPTNLISFSTLFPSPRPAYNSFERRRRVMFLSFAIVTINHYLCCQLNWRPSINRVYNMLLFLTHWGRLTPVDNHNGFR